MRVWDWLRTALGGRWPRPAALPAPETVYVVAGLYRSAQLFVRWTEEDPWLFRIITRPEQLMGLPQGIDVFLILDGGYAGQLEEIVARLRMLRANVRQTSLDQIYGVRRPR